MHVRERETTIPAKAARRARAMVMGAALLALAGSSFPLVCRAADAPVPMSAAVGTNPAATNRAAITPVATTPLAVPMVLTNAVVLSDAAMAKQQAAGLEPPPLATGASGHPPVQLWDELKPQSPAAPTSNTTVTITIGLPRN
ncbi:MAG: hypothetical protein KGL52_15730 [Rhodospirillales bacterium]|nr:hypothetical protein [Rhodospirillales bacterium]